MGGAPQAGVRVPRAVAICQVGPSAPPSLHPAPPSVFLGWPGPPGSPTGALPSFLPAFEVRCSGVCGVFRGLRPARSPLAPTGWLPPSPRGGARSEQGRGHLGRGVPGLSSSRGERLNLRWGGRGWRRGRGTAPLPRTGVPLLLQGQRMLLPQNINPTIIIFLLATALCRTGNTSGKQEKGLDPDPLPGTSVLFSH